jgi:hypothetical protein
MFLWLEGGRERFQKKNKPSLKQRGLASSYDGSGNPFFSEQVFPLFQKLFPQLLKHRGSLLTVILTDFYQK